MPDQTNILSEQPCVRPLKGRFAPSPTGRMHAGNIYASLVAWLVAKSTGGSMVLRIEDLDVARSRVEFADQVQRDYETLGLTWDEGPFYQHDRDSAYEQALARIAAQAEAYPCFCSRADLKQAASAPHLGEKWVYTRTCKYLSAEQRAEKAQVKAPSLRVTVPAKTYTFFDAVQGEFCQNLETECGDFLVRRADGLFAYQLAVVVDDAAQGVSSVTRGYDLITSTPQQLFLQDCLGAAHPQYCHVPLFVNAAGRRLSKRDHDAALETMLREKGSVEALLGHIASVGKLTEYDEPCTAEELLRAFSLSTYAARVREEVGSLEPIVWEA